MLSLPNHMPLTAALTSAPAHRCSPQRPYRLLFLASCVVLLQLLGACASDPQTSTYNPTRLMSDQIGRVLALEEWQVKGNFSLKLRGENKGIKGSLRLRHYPNTYSLSLAGPLGYGRQTLRGYWNEDTVHVTSGDETEQVPIQKLRVPHPRALRRWLVGRPTSQARDVVKDSIGRSLFFRDQGWQVRYGLYERVGGVWLPKRIQLRGPDFTAVVGIRNWNLNL